MNNLDTLKQEARVKWGIEVGPNSTQRGQEKTLLEIIDRVVDEVEKAVNLDSMRLEAGKYPDGSYKLGYVRARDEVRDALTRFRNQKEV